MTPTVRTGNRPDTAVYVARDHRLAVTLRSALVALLVLVAGCGGPGAAGDSAGDRTVTPAPVPTDSPTPRPERAALPDPLAGAAPNATGLGRLHVESLSRRSYLLDTYVSRTWGEGFARSVENRLDRRSYRVQSGGTYRASRVLLVVGSGPASRLPRWEAYADGEAEYRRVVGGGGTSYERRSLAPAALPPHLGRAMALIVRYLDVAEASVEYVRTERGPRIRVVGREPRAPGLGNASDYRVEAVVTGAGRVEILEATYRTPRGVSVRVGFRVRDVGSVRVRPPDWYGEARAETLGSGASTNGTEVADGTPTPAPGASLDGTASPGPTPSSNGTVGWRSSG
jgi:hypothetical protein